MKEESKNSGRSKTFQLPKGKRRMKNGKARAPRSARQNGKIFLFECSEQELKKAGI